MSRGNKIPAPEMPEWPAEMAPVDCLVRIRYALDRSETGNMPSARSYRVFTQKPRQHTARTRRITRSIAMPCNSAAIA
ncbi:hypothetical protein Pla111_08260 [Botrimarina hoheduenensis]|uniref:Uncharacterized protein n=1 Tax=Botrimarina hoheduenensis TaxID=2528000 RepID=A0A5C5W9C0_9BACT|nr:hypothetical protein Pla111_08260 [Botrimarina hoheduenensis]